MPTFRQRITAALAAYKKGAAENRFVLPRNRPVGSIGSQARSYAGAIYDRLTEDWTSPLTTGDAEMKTRIRTLRGRARELERNEPYTRRFLSRLEDNIYDHHGIQFSSLAGTWKRGPSSKRPVFELDEGDAWVIQTAYDRWRKNPVVTKDMTLNEAGRLMLRTTARDGDPLAKYIIDPSINEFGFAIQLLEPDMIDDFRNEVIRSDGRGVTSEIRMGVQVNHFFKAEAYWLLKAHPGDQQWWAAQGYNSEPHDASGFIHTFHRTRITQCRDVTWLCGIMRDLNMLNGYDEAAIVAARTGAAKMGFFTRDIGAPGEGYQGEQGVDPAMGGNKAMDAEPGLIEDLSQTPGMKFTGWDPAYPHENYDSFVKSRIRRIGAGLDMSYYAIANDLTEVNFSSIRAGILEDREHFKALQTWWINAFETPVFMKWLEISLLNGTLRDPVTQVSLPFSKIEKFKNHKFRPRRWPWVDPEKDVNAAKIAVDNRLKSRSEVIEENSQSTFAEVIEEQQREQEYAEEKGVELPPVADKMPPPPKPAGGGESESGATGKRELRPDPVVVNVQIPDTSKRSVKLIKDANGRTTGAEST